MMKIKKSEIKEGKAKSYTFGDEKIIVSNVNGEYFAVGNICSHAEFDIVLGECDLVDSCQVACSKHGARFDVKTGKAMKMPAVASIPVYNVKVVDDELVIEAIPAKG